MAKSDIRAGQSQTLKEQVYFVLKKEPSLKPFYICKVLTLNYQAHGDYISHVRAKWKSDMKFGLPSKPSSSHDVKAACYAPKVADRSKAVSVGWSLSKNRNRMLIWKDPEFGRVEWWETGKILVSINKPQVMGRVWELLCKAFRWTNLIQDDRIIEAFLNSVHWHSSHDVFESGQDLPYMVIDNYVKSHGMRIVLGDLSDPSSAEVQWIHPDWAERFELMHNFNMRTLETDGKIIQQNTEAIQSFNQFMKDLSAPRSRPSQDRSVV